MQRWPDRDGYRAAERLADVALMPANEVPQTTVRWLWPETIAVGHLTLVAGEAGSGKSFWMTDLAARITFARPWPYRRHHAPRGETSAGGRLPHARPICDLQFDICNLQSSLVSVRGQRRAYRAMEDRAFDWIAPGTSPNVALQIANRKSQIAFGHLNPEP